MAKHFISYGTAEITFELKRSDRKTLGITVYPDCRVEVRAPRKAVMDEILKRVEKRARWIVKQQRFFESFLPTTPPREYVSGETHRYLGKQYKLKVVQSEREEVKLMKGRLFVFTKHPLRRDRVKGLLGSWYKKHAERRFDKCMRDAVELFRPFGLTERPPLLIQRMAKRWGSCTPKGRIILNPEIIKAPSRCIDYVVIHEFCHLFHHHHGKAFYDLQRMVMPDWEKWKDRLERVMV